MKLINTNLSEFACQDNMAKRLFLEQEDFRTPFGRDVDRIIYTLSYIRYFDKTQVFTFNENDHVTKRMMHVQYVSRIARTIGRALKLNEDLIEAASLGHDLGHVPFGHVGEVVLNDLSLKYTGKYFNHNVHSVKLLMEIENEGNGVNLNYQVLDAILCHNGEVSMQKFEPKKRSLEEFIKLYKLTYTEKKVDLTPCTLEGCVVRISDLVAYIGRDIEDGERLGLIKFSDIPKEITDVLGSNTKKIINTIILDIIKNSTNKNYIMLSDNIYEALTELKKFNYEHIYYKAYTEKERLDIKNMFYTVYDTIKKDLLNQNKNSDILVSYYKKMSSNYQNNTIDTIVIDYISGMTDNFLRKTYENIINNNKKDNTMKEVENGS